jgi:hypothetical protein
MRRSSGDLSSSFACVCSTSRKDHSFGNARAEARQWWQTWLRVHGKYAGRLSLLPRTGIDARKMSLRISAGNEAICWPRKITVRRRRST